MRIAFARLIDHTISAMSKLVVVIGSVTPPGRLTKAATAMAEAAGGSHPDLDVEILNLADFRIAFADGRPLADYADDTPTVVGKIAAADLVVLATPVYRASFTGALKNLIDHLPVEALMGKPCGIVAMGATAHHFLGAEWHLRDVLTWFGAIVAPTGVYLSSADFVEGAATPAALEELAALTEALVKLGAIAPAPGSGRALGPLPIAARRR